MQVWDTAVSPINHKIHKEYYHGTKGVFLIYDITNINSFNNVRNYNEQINDNIKGPFKVLIGYNSDTENRAVTSEEGKKLADELKIDSFFEIPSIGDEKINEMFNIISIKGLFD